MNYPEYLIQPLALLGYGIAALSIVVGGLAVWMAPHRMDPLDRIPPGKIPALDEARRKAHPPHKLPAEAPKPFALPEKREKWDDR